METRASYLLVGAFVIALVIAAFAFVIFLARFNLESGASTYAVNFTGSVTGLEVGSRVRYRGVPVGSVTSIKIDPQDITRIRVLLEIEDGTPIKEETEATLGLQGITGVAYVNLAGGTQQSPPLRKKEGQEYPEIRSKASSLEKVLEDLPKLFERATEISERLVAILSEDNRVSITETLANLRQVTSVLAERSQGIDTILGEATAAASSFRRTAESAERTVANIDRRVDPITSDAQKSMAEIRKASAEFAKVADKLDKIVEENRRPLRDFSSSGLYELSQFLTEARVLVANLNQLTQQIQRDPARFFFGDSQKGFEAR
jgi:phospholipid/cholesterol/gamma-HCH transport system substrate-binding protein